MLVLIAACEIAFWVVLALGLVLRYPAGRPRAGMAFLLGVPLVDLALLVATVVDLRGGAAPQVAHGLAACYLGFSVVFGHRTVRWADTRFAHRFAGGPPPPPRPPKGWPRARHEWRLFGEAALACTLSAALLLACAVVVDDPSRAAPLQDWIPRLGKVLLVWLVLGPLLDTPWTALRKRA